jgi:hypothetical protein
LNGHGYHKAAEVLKVLGTVKMGGDIFGNVLERQMTRYGIRYIVVRVRISRRKGVNASMATDQFRSGVSATYWVLTGLVLVVGGIFIAIKINLGGIILVAMGLGAFWLASRSTRTI